MLLYGLLVLLGVIIAGYVMYRWSTKATAIVYTVGNTVDSVIKTTEEKVAEIKSAVNNTSNTK